MAYHHEGGGEEDQVKIIKSLFIFHFSEIIEESFLNSFFKTDYDPEPLVRAKHQKNSLMKTRPVKPSLLGPGIPPEDIGQYINAVS